MSSRIKDTRVLALAERTGIPITGAYATSGAWRHPDLGHIWKCFAGERIYWYSPKLDLIRLDASEEWIPIEDEIKLDTIRRAAFGI